MKILIDIEEVKKIETGELSATLVIKSDDLQTPVTAVSLVGGGYAYNICGFDKDG